MCYSITPRVSDDCWPRGKSERMREKLVGRLHVPQAGIELDVIGKKNVLILRTFGACVPQGGIEMIFVKN